MKRLIPIIAVFAISTPACEKVKNLANKGRSMLEAELAAKSGGGAGKTDPALEKLVDRTAEGVVFRKDLPFPKSLEVETTRIEEVSGRVFEKSEIGSGGGAVKGTITTTAVLRRSGDQISYQLVESVFADPLVKGQDAEKQVKRQILPPSTAAFVKAGAKWKPLSNDFHTANLAQSLSPVFDQLLVEHALAPHPLWFGNKRFKVGDTVSVSGKSLPMVVTGNATGALQLKLESFDAVGGHPCGVFSFSGNFTRKGFPSFEGSVTDEERTIESGKLWLSLLYPIILKQEDQSIQTMRGGQSGGNNVHVNGSSKVTTTRDWKPL
ncbi:MAG: hypothetical protein V4640_04535 [Verrucomicrobiota bacterium]